MNGQKMLKLALFAYKLPKEFYRAPVPDFWPPGGVGYLKVLVRFRGPVATQWSFQGFACSCCGLQGVVLRGGFILRFVVLMLVIRGGVFILRFEGGDAGL